MSEQTRMSEQQPAPAQEPAWRVTVIYPDGREGWVVVSGADAENRARLYARMVENARVEPAPVATPPVPTDVESLVNETAEKLTSHYPSYYSTAQVTEIVRAGFSRLAAVSPQPAADLRLMMAVGMLHEAIEIAERNGNEPGMSATIDQWRALVDAALASAPQPAEGRTQETCPHCESAKLGWRMATDALNRVRAALDADWRDPQAPAPEGASHE